MTPNFSAPACMHPSAVAAIALRPSGACQSISGYLEVASPLVADQSLAGQFGPLRQNVRAIPRAVLAWLAAHGFQPDLLCKSHWTAGKVGVRAHGAWDHEVFARDPGWSVFQCLAVPLVAQKSEMVAQISEMVAQISEMAVRADRLADGHKSFIPKRLDCVQ